MLAGCAHRPGGISASSTPIDGREYKRLGRAKGKSSRILLFGFIPVSGSNSTMEALNEAIRSRNGDALVEVAVSSYYQYWILFSKNSTRVEGEVIRFERPGE